MKVFNNLLDELKQNDAMRNSSQFCVDSVEGLNALGNHIKTVHGKEDNNQLKKEFACAQCDQNLNSMESLEMHIAAIHK